MNHQEMLIDGHFIGGPCDQAIGKLVIRAPYDGLTVGSAAEGGWPEMDAAIDAAENAFESRALGSNGERAGLLSRIAALIRERRQHLAEVLVAEIGKPIVFAEGEVDRLALTFDLAAETALTWGEARVDVNYDPRSKGCQAVVKRFPIGPILGIVPYNWPLNLAAHKLAPAIASGCPIVLKPSSRSPISTLELARICHEAGTPAGSVNAVPCEPRIAEEAAQDPRIRLVSFTGSPAVGWKLKGLLPDKRVSLELGGDASVVVHQDADLEDAVTKIVAGAFAYAGQICISIQHIRVHEAVASRFSDLLKQAVRACPYGDPADRRVISGPLIDEDATAKVQSWIEAAIQGGAQIVAQSETLVGSIKRRTLIPPTVLSQVPGDSDLACKEVFGPVATLQTYASLDEVIAHVNASDFGIHCGIFTHDDSVIAQCFDEIEVGGVVINDSPSLRFDKLPYGGVKLSGFGREGVPFAMEEFSELKSLVIRPK